MLLLFFSQEVQQQGFGGFCVCATFHGTVPLSLGWFGVDSFPTTRVDLSILDPAQSGNHNFVVFDRNDRVWRAQMSAMLRVVYIYFKFRVLYVFTFCYDHLH